MTKNKLTPISQVGIQIFLSVNEVCLIDQNNRKYSTFLGFDVMDISSAVSDRRKAMIEHMTGDNRSTANPNSNYKQRMFRTIKMSIVTLTIRIKQLQPHNQTT